MAAYLVGAGASAGPALADTINPDREFLRADTNVVRWCASNFQNPRLTPFVGCDVGNAFAEQVGVATTTQVVFFQHVSGGIIVTRCGGKLPCFNPRFWTGIRKVIVRLRPNAAGVLKRRVVRRSWRCTPGGTNGPLNFIGVRCFAPNDPRTPR